MFADWNRYIIITRNSEECTGNFFIDEEVLESEGITDLDKYPT
jgi:citronellol/citronellal dehydrogenase